MTFYANDQWDETLNAYLEGRTLRADAEDLLMRLHLDPADRDQIERSLRLTDELTLALRQIQPPPAGAESRLLTALRVMEVMARSGKSLADLVSGLKVFPQTIKNIRVREKVPFQQVPQVQNAIDAAERELNGNGRVVVRYSGTEALARVMVEAESEEKMRSLATNIATAIQSTLGA